jgi:hypothetical protein
MLSGAVCLLLGALLMATPLEPAGLAAGAMFGGAWLSLVLAMTLPTDRERAGRELVRRLAQFRHEVNAVGDTPSRAALEHLIDRVAELGLREEEVRDDVAQLRACIEALDLQAHLSRGELPHVEAVGGLAPGDACHFVCPVRFGRRRADQVGHLLLSACCLQFRGALDVSVAWSEVATVRRDGREILVRLQDSTRTLRFSCPSHAEAARAGILAEHLARLAHGDTGHKAPECHASA